MKHTLMTGLEILFPTELVKNSTTMGLIQYRQSIYGDITLEHHKGSVTLI